MLRVAAAIIVATITLASQSSLKHSGATAALPHDPDDPAIWRHPTDPAKSLLTTDKIEARGGLYVFGVDGALRQTITPLDRPNNVDIERGVQLGSRTVDVAVVTERKQRRLRVFAIPADGGTLYDLAPLGLAILAGATGDAAEPMNSRGKNFLFYRWESILGSLARAGGAAEGRATVVRPVLDLDYWDVVGPTEKKMGFE